MTLTATQADASIKQAINTLVAAGLAAPDTDVDMTTNLRRSGSFNSQVLELSPGESVSKVRPLDPTITVQRLPAELPLIREQVRNSCAPAVKRAREQTGSTYSVEVGDVVMPGGSLYVVAVVTRKD